MNGVGDIDAACKSVVDTVDGAMACGIVDLETGILLGMHNSLTSDPALTEDIARAAVDLFRGPSVGVIEQLVDALHQDEPPPARPAGTADLDPAREVHITSTHTLHFAKAIRGGTAVIVMVTRKTTNIGMGWAQLKAVIPEVERLVR